MEKLGLLSSEFRSCCSSHPTDHIACLAKLPKRILRCVLWIKKIWKLPFSCISFFTYQSKLMIQGVLDIVWSKVCIHPWFIFFCHLIFSGVFIKVILTWQNGWSFLVCFVFNLPKLVRGIFPMLIGLLERNVFLWKEIFFFFFGGVEFSILCSHEPILCLFQLANPWCHMWTFHMCSLSIPALWLNSALTD